MMFARTWSGPRLWRRPAQNRQPVWPWVGSLGLILNVVQALLGHAALSSTQIYIRAADDHMRGDAHRLPVRGVLWGMRQDTRSR